MIFGFRVQFWKRSYSMNIHSILVIFSPMETRRLEFFFAKKSKKNFAIFCENFAKNAKFRKFHVFLKNVFFQPIWQRSMNNQVPHMKEQAKCEFLPVLEFWFSILILRFSHFFARVRNAKKCENFAQSHQFASGTGKNEMNLLETAGIYSIRHKLHEKALKLQDKLHAVENQNPRE